MNNRVCNVVMRRIGKRKSEWVCSVCLTHESACQSNLKSSSACAVSKSLFLSFFYSARLFPSFFYYFNLTWTLSHHKPCLTKQHTLVRLKLKPKTYNALC